MADSSSLARAVAVSEAGGLGSLACAALDEEGLRGILTTAAQKTRKPLNVNCFAHEERLFPPRATKRIGNRR